MLRIFFNFQAAKIEQRLAGKSCAGTVSNKRREKCEKREIVF